VAVYGALDTCNDTASRVGAMSAPIATYSTVSYTVSEGNRRAIGGQSEGNRRVSVKLALFFRAMIGLQVNPVPRKEKGYSNERDSYKHGST